MKQSINAYTIRATISGQSWSSFGATTAAPDEQSALDLFRTRFADILKPEHELTAQHEIIHHISDILQNDNYPYGYKRTTATHRVEFVKGKGCRTVFRTLNPKTGRWNAEKKSTYSGPTLPSTEVSTGHFSDVGIGHSGADNINTMLWFMNDFHECFDVDQIKDIAVTTIALTKAHAHATCIYKGSKWDDIKEYFDAPVKTLVEIANTGEPLWNKAIIDEKGIESKHVKDFNPFKVVQYTSI